MKPDQSFDSIWKPADHRSSHSSDNSVTEGERTTGATRRTTLLGCTLGDTVIVIALISAAVALADWRRLHPGQSKWLRHDLSHEIGAEYDTIAQAIRKGRGFSDPFHEPTGPTAWMPPILAFFTSGLYWITGDDRDRVVDLILVCQCGTVLLGCLIVVGVSRRLNLVYAGYFVLIAGAAADYFELFQRTHDVWLNMLVINLTWLGLNQFAWPPGRAWAASAWGFFGGLAALCGPVTGFAWAGATTASWLSCPGKPQASEPMAVRPTMRRRILSVLLAAAAAIVVVTPWMVRNRIVLGKWIPIKSNAVYEIWQSQVLDDDGVLDTRSAWKHPWGFDGPQRERYQQVGELAFIEERWAPTVASIRDQPSELVRRIGNRFFAATIYYTPLMKKEEFMTGRMAMIRAYFPLPFFALITIVWLRRGPLTAPIFSAVCLYVFALMPYIAISYYSRYAAPLVFMKMILILYAMQAIRSRLAELSGRTERDDSRSPPASVPGVPASP